MILGLLWRSPLLFRVYESLLWHPPYPVCVCVCVCRLQLTKTAQIKSIKSPALALALRHLAWSLDHIYVRLSTCSIGCTSLWARVSVLVCVSVCVLVAKANGCPSTASSLYTLNGHYTVLTKCVTHKC